jgi:hypothetical protein
MPIAKIVAALALALAATAADAEDNLPHFTDPIPQALYQQFRDQVILPGKCPAWKEAVDQGATPDEQMDALDACWLDFIAPRS